MRFAVLMPAFVQQHCGCSGPIAGSQREPLRAKARLVAVAITSGLALEKCNAMYPGTPEFYDANRSIHSVLDRMFNTFRLEEKKAIAVQAERTYQIVLEPVITNDRHPLFRCHDLAKDIASQMAAKYFESED
jgi:hypothetical protein